MSSIVQMRNALNAFVIIRRKGEDFKEVIYFYLFVLHSVTVQIFYIPYCFFCCFFRCFSHKSLRDSRGICFSTLFSQIL